MKFFLAKSLTRNIFLTLSIAACFMLLLILFGNKLLNQSKIKIENGIGAFFNQLVSIEDLHFVLPNIIVLDNVSVYRPSSLGDKKTFFTEKVKFRFSLGKLLVKKVFVIKDVSVYKLEGDYSDFISFLTKIVSNSKENINIRKSELGFSLSIKDALFKVSEKKKRYDYFSVNFIFKIKNNKLEGKGSASLEHFFLIDRKLEKLKLLNKPLVFLYKGSLNNGDIIFDNLEFKRGDLYVKMWGIIENEVLRLNGYLKLKDIIKDYLIHKPSYTDAGKIRVFTRKIRKTFNLGPSPSDIYIYDLSSVVSLDFPNIKIINIGFSVKNVPYDLKGDLILNDPIKLDLVFSSYLRQDPQQRKNNPKKFDIRLIGDFKDMTYTGKVVYDFTNEYNGKINDEKINILLDKANFKFSCKRGMDVSINKLKMDYYKKNNTYKFLFTNFKNNINFNHMRFKFLNYTSEFFDGKLEGKGYFDTAMSPFGLSLIFDVNGLSTETMAGIVPFFSKIKGKMETQANYRNWPNKKFYGTLIVRDGTLSNLQFLDWLSKFFKIPQLNQIEFSDISANFLVNNDIASLQNISLTSEDVGVGGYFRLYDNQLINSRLSLFFSREVLEASPRFKLILKLLGKDFTDLGFDFQLSGLLHDINFKWLDSYFKKRVRDSIPDFIERGLERKIDNIIQKEIGQETLN